MWRPVGVNELNPNGRILQFLGLQDESFLEKCRHAVSIDIWK